MIQKESKIEVADNSGAKVILVIGVLEAQLPRPTPGERLASATWSLHGQKSLPNSAVKSRRYRSSRTLFDTKYPTRRKDGFYVRFDSNACVILKEGNPAGTRIFGAVARELRERNYMKIVSLASEVV